MRGASPPSQTDQAHIVKETQRDADDLTGSVGRPTPSTSASASIEALVAMRIELQARSKEGNQTMQRFDATGLDSRFKSFRCCRALSLWTGRTVISSN